MHFSDFSTRNWPQNTDSERLEQLRVDHGMQITLNQPLILSNVSNLSLVQIMTSMNLSPRRCLGFRLLLSEDTRLNTEEDGRLEYSFEV